MDFGIEFETRSVQVAAVAQGSPAHGLGIRPGDRLTHLAGMPVCNRDQVAATWLIRHEGCGDHLTVWRDGEVLTLQIPAGLDVVTFAERTVSPIAVVREQLAADGMIDLRRRALADLVGQDPSFARERSGVAMRQLMEAFEAMEQALAGRAQAGRSGSERAASVA